MGVGTLAYPRRRPASRAAGALLHPTRAVYDFIYREVGNRQDAEELTKRVFDRVAVPRGQLKDGAVIDSLCTGVRAILAEHWHRHYAGSPAFSIDPSRGGEVLGVRPLPAPEHADRRGIEALVHTLPVAERRVLVLRFLDGLSVKETARELDIGETTVRERQRRALKLLASAIESHWWAESDREGFVGPSPFARDRVEVLQ